MPSKWALQRWGLRPKVAVVVAFPLVVALVLGSLRLVGEIRDAVDLADVAQSAHTLPAVVETEAAVAAIAGRTAGGTVVAADLGPLTVALNDLNRVRDQKYLPAAAASAMQDMATVAAELRTPAPSSAATVDSAVQIQHAVAADSDIIVEAVLRPINSAELSNDKNLLLDLWAAQRQLFEVAVGLIRVIKDPSDPGYQLYEANGGNAVLLERVSRYYPDDDPRIRALRDSLRAEAPLLDKVRAAIPHGAAAIRNAGYGNALIHDQAVYEQLVDQDTTAISDAVDAGVRAARDAALRYAVVLLATLVIGLAITTIVARTLLRPLRVLHDSARRVAEVDLPAEVARIHAGNGGDAMSFTPVPVDSDEEIGRVARAVDDIHGQALRLAEQQRKLRLTINDLFDALARRTKALLDRQLALIGALEEHEQDPKRLESLFQLDHLATRMRRNGDNLLVLAGTEGTPARIEPMSIAQVVQASISEVEEYQRVRMENMPDVAVKGVASVDVVHLLSELLDNALRASPPNHEVLFRCLPTTDGSVVLEIIDQGIGIGTSDLAQLNAQLSSPPEVSSETARRMGLFVVGRLAERHGITVRLQRSAARLDAKAAPPPEEHREGARLRTAFDPFATGVTATVHIPDDLLVESEEAREAVILNRLEAEWWS